MPNTVCKTPSFFSKETVPRRGEYETGYAHLQFKFCGVGNKMKAAGGQPGLHSRCLSQSNVDRVHSSVAECLPSLHKALHSGRSNTNTQTGAEVGLIRFVSPEPNLNQALSCAC